MNTYGDRTDDDGRLWTYDKKAKVWYAPDWGLEFETLDELDAEYGPLTVHLKGDPDA